MGAGGGGTTTQYVKSETSNLPAYAQPYFQSLMGGAQGLLSTDYIPYGGQRVADFTPDQRAVQSEALNLQSPNQFAQGSNLAAQAALGSMMAGNYRPGGFSAQQIGQPNLQQFQMGPPQQVQGSQSTAPQMGAAQTGFNPNLMNFQMGPVRDVSGFNVSGNDMQAAQTSFGQGQGLQEFRTQAPEIFGQPQAEQYMTPYMRSVLDVQKREAVNDARRAQLIGDLGAARQGTYGGSRQLIAGLEREGDLRQQLGDIEARGMQSAFENAQQQFERDRAARMGAEQTDISSRLQTQQLGTQTGLQTALANLSAEQQARVNNQATQLQAQGMNAEQALRAALANQGADITRGQQNLQSQLQTQQLGTQTGLQAALANLDADSQSRVQNLASQLQTQGLNADQALRAALANQQAGLTTGQQNLQSLLSTQQLGAQVGLDALRANQQASLEAQRMAEQSRQFGSQQQLAGLGQAGGLAQTLGNLGQLQQQGDISRLNFQTQQGAMEQALQQQYLDTAYQDFLRQRDFPLEMLQQYSSLLRGVPVAPNSTTTSYAPNPGIAQQLLGTGLGALGMANALR